MKNYNQPDPPESDDEGDGKPPVINPGHPPTSEIDPEP